MSAACVAEIAGVSRSTVSNWVKAVDEQGFDALKTVKQNGRPSKLSNAQKAEIDSVLQQNPSDYGYKVWDGPTLSNYIQEQYHIELGVRQCQRLFHELGYSKIRPQSFQGRSKISYSGFVIPENGTLFTDTPEKFNYLTTIESVRAFLKAAAVPVGKKYAIVMDNAPWHKKMYRLIVTENRDEYADIRETKASNL